VADGWARSFSRAADSAAVALAGAVGQAEVSVVAVDSVDSVAAPPAVEVQVAAGKSVTLIAPGSPSLVAYVTVGDPSLAQSETIITALIDAGADVIELGVPFSDPVADGPVIQRASERALQNGVTLADVLALASRIRKARPSAKLIVFSYLNPILRFGIERFASQAKACGVDGVLITDLTPEEADQYRKILRSEHLHTIFLAAPTSSDARLKRIAECSTGFIYAVSRTGVTGTDRAADIEGEVKKLVTRIRKFSKLPVAVGFGISNAQQFRAVTNLADAAVVGSAIVKTIEQNSSDPAQAAAKLVRDLKR
jgi:tryptophan synthase alpha chain